MNNVEVFRATQELDVLTKQGLERCIEYVEAHKDVHLWGSIPCTPWSQIQNLNIAQHGESFKEYLARERSHSLQILGRFLKLARIVKENGGTVVFEWTKSATGWNEKLVTRMIKELGLRTVLFDGCTQGLESKRTSKPIKKPWRLETDNDEIEKYFSKSFCKGGHEHEKCEGSETKASGHYPPQMGKNICLCFKRTDVQKIVKHQQSRFTEQVNLLIEEVGLTATKEEIEAFAKLNKGEQQQLLDAARKVHVNTGHRPPGDLARLLRQNGAPLASRAAMEQIKCSSCQEHKRPEPFPIATLSTSTTPWKVLGIDIKEYKTKIEKLKFIVFVDEATRLVKVSLLFKIPANKHRNATTDENHPSL